MSILYLVIKLYPLFGLSMAILCIDLTRTYRRRLNSIWVGFAIFAVLFIASVILWVFFRGDLNSEKWIRALIETFR
jgi:ABC-type polysaccharide transport system permease subunit